MRQKIILDNYYLIIIYYYSNNKLIENNIKINLNYIYIKS